MIRSPANAGDAITWLPLAAHAIPSLAIGFGVVIPGSCIEGLNEHSIGFFLTVAGFVPAYMAGVRLAARRGQS